MIASGLGTPTWRSRPAASTTAAPWLDRCLGRRPDDPAVWQAHLELAMATADEPGFWNAVAHLPADAIRSGRGPGATGLADGIPP